MKIPVAVPTHARQLLQFGVGMTLAVVLLAWGLPYFAQTSWGAIWAVIRGVPPQVAIGLQALMLLGLYSYTFTFTGSLRGLSHGKALVINLCGSSVSNLLPGGGAVGLAATYAICRSWGFSRRATSTSAIVTGVWNVLARIAVPVVAILLLMIGGVTLPQALVDLAVAGSLTGLGIIAAVAGMMASERVAQRIGALIDRVVGPLVRRRRPHSAMSVAALVTDLRARIIDVVRWRWWSMTLGMIGFFGIYYLLFVLVMRQTGVGLALNLLFAAYAIGRLLSAVGITPGGVGVTEATTTIVLVGWGADPAAASAGVVLFSILTHLMEVPLGGLGWLLWSLSTKVEPPEEGTEPTLAAARPVTVPDLLRDAGAAPAGEGDPSPEVPPEAVPRSGAAPR
ncbi:lysylphosphatidylglycerol synthase transmembrane domain-containing protein [Nostocoides sp. Soil756]|uniref:lysylphosphatidylglycerol synthase transmembrane domain-containing protein n=1 Tax=Nostocoides sp. Soil756 TaxID=1736399 RepID=UPI000A643DFC|nr:lysylphosphatidylglycerol synthase transmembrane domain-containing protein [Tetrasphaera sp. Soil756]